MNRLKGRVAILFGASSGIAKRPGSEGAMATVEDTSYVSGSTFVIDGGLMPSYRDQ